MRVFEIFSSRENERGPEVVDDIDGHQAVFRIKDFAARTLIADSSALWRISFANRVASQPSIGQGSAPNLRSEHRPLHIAPQLTRGFQSANRPDGFCSQIHTCKYHP